MNKTLILIHLVLVGLLSTGCSFWQSGVAPEASIKFSIDDISAVGQARSVSLGGEASLPDGIQLAVSAVRPLERSEGDEQRDDRPIYAILDRQFVEVEEGRWQADLTLQERDNNGDFFESWQFDGVFSENVLKPSSEVLFILALEPTNLTEEIQDRLVNDAFNDGENKLSYTSNGEPYMRVEQAIAMPAPTGNAAKDNEETLASYLETWQPRSAYSPPVEESEENIKIPFYEEDNLDLPTANMLQ